MKLLLDTCTFLWMVLEPARLSGTATGHISDPANSLYLSSVSAWEIAVLYNLRRVVLRDPPPIFVPAQRQRHGIDSLALHEEAALHVHDLPRLHRDPFDRMLVCQALVHPMTILTPDPLIRQYVAPTIW